MRRIVLACSVALLVIVFPVAVQAQPNPNELTSIELVDGAPDFDGKVIIFTGEAIGEAQERGEFSWVHLNDDPYMFRNVEEGAKLDGYNTGMPVWIDAEQARLIPRFGDYHNEGAIVRVTGVFNAACAEHGGDLDIHAKKIDVLTEGCRALDPLRPGKLGVAVALAVLSAAVWVGNRGASHRMSRGIRWHH